MLNLSILLTWLLLILLPKHHAQLTTIATTADFAACSHLERHEIEHRLSTKTPYRAIANYNDTPPIYNGMTLAIQNLGICYKIYGTAVWPSTQGVHM